MMTLVFGHTAGEPGASFGPMASFHIEGPLILAGPGGKQIAHHREHFWELEDGRKFFRLDVTGPVRVRFEDAGKAPKSFGPYRHYSMADGIAYVDREFFASFSEKSSLWHCLAEQEDWPAFTVVSAAVA